MDKPTITEEVPVNNMDRLEKYLNQVLADALPEVAPEGVGTFAIRLIKACGAEINFKAMR